MKFPLFHLVPLKQSGRTESWTLRFVHGTEACNLTLSHRVVPAQVSTLSPSKRFSVSITTYIFVFLFPRPPVPSLPVWTEAAASRCTTTTTSIASAFRRFQGGTAVSSFVSDRSYRAFDVENNLEIAWCQLIRFVQRKLCHDEWTTDPAVLHHREWGVSNSLIRSHLDYCCEVWDTIGVTASEKLQKLQMNSEPQGSFFVLTTVLAPNLCWNNWSWRTKQQDRIALTAVQEPDRAAHWVIAYSLSHLRSGV